MINISFHTKTRSALAHIIGLKGSQSESLVVSVHSLKTGKQLNLYTLPLSLADKAAKIKSYSALVAFAKANQITDIVSDLKAADKSPSCSAPLPTTQGRSIPIERKRSTSCPAVTAYAPYSGKSDGKASLFIDVETTGLTVNDEIVEIAISDANENIIYQSLVKPSKPIPKKATAIHGITNKMVSTAPSFAQIWADLKAIINDAPLVFYNAKFDTRIIAQSARISFDYSKRIYFNNLFNNNVSCLMVRYARDYAPFGRWQTLIDACYQQNIPTNDVPNHRAAGDAIKTVRLYKHLYGGV